MSDPDKFDVSNTLTSLLAALGSSADPAGELLGFVHSGAFRTRFVPVAKADVCSDADSLACLPFSSRGPSRGEGVGPGRPSRGVVEDTECLWITWILGDCRLAGRPVPTSVSVDGCRITLKDVTLTYGRRYYFLCPRCHRRTECLYRIEQEWACRRCHRLLYESQVTRPGSPNRRWRRALDRDPVTARPGRKYFPQDAALKGRRRHLGGTLDYIRNSLIADKIARILARVRYLE